MRAVSSLHLDDGSECGFGRVPTADIVIVAGRAAQAAQPDGLPFT
jgi:hypothetical protein